MGIDNRQERVCNDTARAVALMHGAVREADGHVNGCAACFVMHYVLLGLVALGMDTACVRNAADEIDMMIKQGQVDAIKERINLHGDSN